MAEQISGIPAEMQACQIVEFNKPPEIRTIPTPKEMQPHEMLIKVAAASICHTDLEYMKGNFPIKLPITGSHEGTGTVAAVGSNVKNFQPGDRVMVGMVFDRCGNCEICNGPEKFRLYCEKKDPLMSMMSVGRDGPWQEYLVVDGREAALLPDRMSFATAAPLACAGVVAWRGVVLADLKAGQWIGIVGSGGGLGHLAIQLAKAQGLKVFAVDAREPGIELSKQCGADLVLDARDGEEAIEKAAKETTASGGVAATLNLSDAPTALPIACAITKVSGTVVQIAVGEEAALTLKHYILRDIRMKGSFMAAQSDCQEVLDKVVQHNIKVENNIFHGLDAVSRIVKMLQNAEYRGKATIVVDEETYKDDQANKRV